MSGAANRPDPALPTHQPRLVTYAHAVADVPRLIEAGANHIIWDDPRVSIRSWAPAHNDDWGYLSEVAATVRACRPAIRLSLNLDGLYKDVQLPVVAAAMQASAAAGFDAIRLMDGGLGPMARRLAPELALELATEMGNCSIPSVSVYADEGFQYQSCSNDWPVEDLQVLRNQRPDVAVEILVHGPVLLQYSDRRQLSAYAEPDANPDTLPSTDWHTVVIEGRPYPFADHQHGTVMYNTFDRCLFRHGQQLCSLGLSGWLIDGRGQAPEYVETALRAFAALRAAAGGALASDSTADEDRDHGMDSECIQQWWGKLEACSGRPLKPGFFIANNTDRCFEEMVVDQQEFNTLAEVVDVVRNGWMTLVVRQPFDPEDRTIEFETPNGRVTQLDLSRMTDLDGNHSPYPTEDSVVRLPWTKGAVPASRLRHAVDQAGR